MQALIGPRTFIPITWMCKKQGAVSHSSSEAEIIALEIVVRMEVIPALTLWDTVIDIQDMKRPTRLERQTQQKRDEKRTAEDILLNVEYCPQSQPNVQTRARCWIMEDNEACIPMCAKGRSPKMQHVTRTHRVSLDWLYERVREDPAIRIMYINTKSQLAGIMSKGSFTQATWNVLTQLNQLGASAKANKSLKTEAAAAAAVSFEKKK